MLSSSSCPFHSMYSVFYFHPNTTEIHILSHLFYMNNYYPISNAYVCNALLAYDSMGKRNLLHIACIIQLKLCCWLFINIFHIWSNFQINGSRQKGKYKNRVNTCTMTIYVTMKFVCIGFEQLCSDLVYIQSLFLL